jgi:diphthine synthase
LGELVFVGLGLNNEMGISLQGLEKVKTADAVFIELYTSLLPDFSVERFTRISGKKPRIVSRRELEEENGKVLLDAAKTGKAVLLVPGDPLVATTHVALRIEAEKQRICTSIIHGASILSAVIGLSGLHNYKFGKSVTIPFLDTTPSETPYDVIAQNKKLGLHTLCLLDINAKEKRYLTIREGLDWLLKVEEKRKKKTVTLATVAVGIARAGSQNPTVKADSVERLRSYDFGGPPHSIVFPGRLHFMEAEALMVLAGAPGRIKEMVE